LSTYASAVLFLGGAYQYALNTMLGGPQIRSEHDEGKKILAGKPAHMLQSIARPIWHIFWHCRWC